ncbi:TRAF type zinc finger domain containing 1 [Rhynchospora pubera]|uniref:TRAF type zinc finger domain containing 1 n=2 Tax=Rhynchospora pubera TaxID=906938 RepID=A0AAV8BZN9_9POAL|nr:TRAF type zinc finger domain containing 1 [Rhynchospora pubera]KAJ4748693.1 TRAF type zinc finger domain containing 1 [Rhynchospora pubera]KAJ4798350.1 TRAF type zinc finger domain containing 1 [Rhynchospora pubera]
MASTSEQLTSTCAHCQRDIPSSNFDLHFAHCSRNLEKCVHCGEMVPRKLVGDHYNETHAPVTCSLCSETVEREAWSLHKSDNCPKRMVTCKYCELPLPALDIIEHEDVCGNRTDYCGTCRKYVRLRELADNHQCSIQDVPSRVNSTGPLGASRGIGARDERPPPRRPRNNGPPHKHLIFTIAITGLAVLIGSLIFHRS